MQLTIVNTQTNPAWYVSPDLSYETEIHGRTSTACIATQTEWLVAPAVPNRELFEALRVAWRTERPKNSSLISEICFSPSYLRIMGMGKDALPFIMEQLIEEGEEPDHWFMALQAITGADPVDEENRGDIVMMAEAWLRWGEKEGYVG
jgi:hypothetical protein